MNNIRKYQCSIGRTNIKIHFVKQIWLPSPSLLRTKWLFCLGPCILSQNCYPRSLQAHVTQLKKVLLQQPCSIAVKIAPHNNERTLNTSYVMPLAFKFVLYFSDTTVSNLQNIVRPFLAIFDWLILSLLILRSFLMLRIRKFTILSLLEKGLLKRDQSRAESRGTLVRAWRVSG